MQSKTAQSPELISIVRENAKFAAVAGINAHLREIPRCPGDFRVVVTFHHDDDSLSEAVLTPIEAARLVSEILRTIDQGNGGCAQSASQCDA